MKKAQYRLRSKSRKPAPDMGNGDPSLAFLDDQGV